MFIEQSIKAVKSGKSERTHKRRAGVMTTEKGAENRGFEDDTAAVEETNGQPTDQVTRDRKAAVDGQVELQDMPVPTSTQEAKIDDDLHAAAEEHRCTGWIGRCQSVCSGFSSRHQLCLSWIRTSTLLVLFHAYFVVAVVHDFEKAKTLVVLTVLGWVGVFYIKVFKVYCVPYLEKILLSPLRKRVYQIWGRKWFRMMIYCCLAAALIACVLGITAPNWERLTPVCGLVVFVLFLFLFSKSRSKVRSSKPESTDNGHFFGIEEFTDD
ncbi:unnamed protein product [Soboliphyme baturini]|uniref:Transmembrane protein 72 n=1 Tax=Soboliphyme baturini TaxID=241478 RepID=A0A183I9A7_9BILA|nr:unnamed protein product [Soboliphyme baturini]